MGGDFREGGVRAGGVSAHETMPAPYPYPKKTGYDEHRPGYRPGDGTIHGEPGVEGIEERPGDEDEAPPKPEGSDGFACGVGGCGFSARTAHGLARHAKTHGATRVGHALRR